ncbi:Arginine decarboxylase [compost metagenome]
MGIEQAEGLLSAEMVIPYPPGIAILYPGESVTAEIISEIKQLSALGAKFQGAADTSMATLAVYAE